METNEISRELGLSEIKTKELPSWMEACKAMPIDETLETLQLIDTMLIIQKTYRLLTRKKGLKKQLEGIIEHNLKLNPKNLNIK